MVADVTPPLARTNEEAHLFLELHPCPCGESDFEPTSALTQVGDDWICRYSGECVACGRPRAYEFRQPAEIVVPDETVWAEGDRPSELLDAGEWLWVADIYASRSTEHTNLSEAARRQLRTDLLAARAAVLEVFKFLPTGAGEVPAAAFWSERGRAVRDAEPGRFGRLRLEAARTAYDRMLADPEWSEGRLGHAEEAQW
jgi:hypothetical protein